MRDQLIRIGSFGVAIILIVGTAWVIGLARTMGWGIELRQMLVLLVMALLSACLSVLLVARWVQYPAIVAGVVLLFVLGVPLLYAGVQEYAVQQHNDCPHAEDRWWPYEGHGVFCTEDGRWIGHD